MNWKTWVPLVLAIVLGLVAMKVARDVMSQKNGGSSQAAKLTDVVVLKNDLMAGTALKAEDVVIGRMTGELSPESIFRNVSEVEGRVISVPMFKGQPVVENLLKPKGTGAGLQALVPEGMRAITVEINEFSGLAGFLLPGCRVDVVATISGENSNDNMVSRTIVQNVLVSALGQRHQNDPSAEKTEQLKSVTLIVAPKEAEAIELAAATGRPRLVLRSSGDTDQKPSDGITVAELRGKARKNADPFMPVEYLKPISSPPPVTISSPTTQPQAQTDDWEPTIRRSVRVIRGGVESDVTMELPNPRTPKWMTNTQVEPAVPTQGRN
jgi:pilus assembly protein CpaB